MDDQFDVYFDNYLKRFAQMIDNELQKAALISEVNRNECIAMVGGMHAALSRLVIVMLKNAAFQSMGDENLRKAAEDFKKMMNTEIDQLFEEKDK